MDSGMDSGAFNQHPSKNFMTTKLPTWIDSALSFGSGRKLIIAQDARVGGLFAILDFADVPAPDGNFRIGGTGSTPEEAIAALDHALMEDAADDMVKSGAV